MGQNLPAKKYKAGERTARHLRFVFSVADSEAETYIDIAKALSALNHRFYRQGLYYYVAKMTIHNSSNAWVSATVVPDTWMTKQAWIRGFRVWQKMQSRAVDAGGFQGAVGPYRDFKVAMDGSHTFSSSELPTYSSISPNDLVCDEWVQTTLVSDDPDNTIHDPNEDPHEVDTFLLHMVGPHNGANEDWTSVGLIASLMSTREVPATNAPVAASDMVTDPITNMFDAGDSHDDVIGLMNTEGDKPPYDADQLVGSLDDDDSLVVAQCATGGSGSGTVGVATGFCAPFGLIKIITDESPDDAGSTIGSIEVNLELVPGSYHGVYAERVI